MNILVKSALGTAAGCCLFLGALRAAEPEPPAKAARDPAAVATEIDKHLDKRLTEAKIPASPAADDAEFCRRAYLDLTGRIPTAEQAKAFLDSKEPDKRAKLIDELLASPNYGRHLSIIWSDMIVKRDENNRVLRPDKFKEWLADGFNKNRGWHEIVTDLLLSEGTADASPPSLFFLANREMTRLSQAKVVAATTNLFMGIQLQCAECHNHAFIKDWKQTDFWSMAAFFTKMRAEGGQGMNVTQTGVTITEKAASSSSGRRPGGGGFQRPGTSTPRGPVIAIPDPVNPQRTTGTARAKFFQGEEPTLEDSVTYRKPFAEWLTAPENKFFSPAMANRMWAHFFARGFVNPIEDMHDGNPPSHPELLKYLAKEFTESEYDLKHLVRCICLTRAYQRTSRPLKENEDDAALFSRMAVKVMSAEVLYDSLCTAMGTTSLGSGGGGPSRFGGGGQRGGGGSDRERFVNFFTTRDEGDEATDFGFGIPQFLRLMNSSQFNRGGAVIDRLVKEGDEPAPVIEGMFLATLSRLPTDAERKKFGDYIAKQEDRRAAYNGVLWILLNSAEFVCNR